MESPPEQAIDWAEARRFLHETVRRRLDREDPMLIEDLTQESLVRLLRAARRDAPRNLEALMTEIGRRVAIDHLRKRTRWSAIVEPASDITTEAAISNTPRPDQIGDPVSRVRFIVLNFFGPTDCGELARAYFEQKDWQSVAKQIQKTHSAVRRQWSRCVEKLRQAVRIGPTVALLAEWAED